MKLEALDEVLEELYESGSEIVDLYSDNKSDEGLRNLIVSIYNFIQSSPFPEKWLTEKCEMYNVTDKKDFGETIWGKELIKFARTEILGTIEELEKHNDSFEYKVSSLESLPYKSRRPKRQ